MLCNLLFFCYSQFNNFIYLSISLFNCCFKLPLIIAWCVIMWKRQEKKIKQKQSLWFCYFYAKHGETTLSCYKNISNVVNSLLTRNFDNLFCTESTSKLLKQWHVLAIFKTIRVLLLPMSLTRTDATMAFGVNFEKKILLICFFKRIRRAHAVSAYSSE